MRLQPLFAIAAGLQLAATALAASNSSFVPSQTCEVKAAGDPNIDDAPTVLAAFERCGNNSRIVFAADTIYHINSVMEVRDLQNVQIDIHGTLLWSANIDYWLAHSMPVGYQNQSTAFILGGDNVNINGFGTGTLDGNGDVWYRWIDTKHNKSNWPGRPHQITFNGLTNSTVENLNFLRSQMWTMSIIYSHYVDLNNIFVNNTGTTVQSFNNDGADTIYSSHINFDRWTVYNGDDSISLKANSTDVSITNSVFYDGSGIAFGSIGQFRDVFETIERVKVDNITLHNTIHAAWVKTWTNDQNGYAPNGGGGGLGFASNISITNVHATALRAGAFTISQCTRFWGAPGDGNCTNSRFQVRDITIDGMTGTSRSSVVTSLQCSAVAPCEDISIRNVDIALLSGPGSGGSGGKDAGEYLCGNALDLQGFNCTGTPCVGGSAIGECSSASSSNHALQPGHSGSGGPRIISAALGLWRRADVGAALAVSLWLLC
ncbi:galacturan 1,4-alpha-galacturonidase B [Microdochium trichocladiopsis]|uniref:Galacturan 1,4-alpha-galacturonidase B n=1 Tax=Microdochium trichocladiopsis TaxID=1682393 RepID=A0A9P8XTI3_9PEZI|nr:galacturan 1,4-alpha-galacturonidase B [Microdochium trichocladiopsis]KAH7014301.1 galacturan 1,4-alpha-galacturonidase B [Microdochium trichocladiopsis]